MYILYKELIFTDYLIRIDLIYLEKAVLQKLFRVLLITFLMPLSSALLAETDVEQKRLDNIKMQIEKNIPSIKIDDITKSKMPGVYEVLSSGQLLYVSEDAKYLLSGKLFSIEKGIRDLTDESMAMIDMKVAPMRRDKVKAVNESDMIIFKAANEKHRITVFTDVDCAYCRKLHTQMPNYNNLGITVQYMGFPRAGLGSPSHQKLQTIWCAADRNDAMDKAKLDRVFGTDSCDDPLASHYKLVREFGLTGTPAIILKSGRYIPGYADAEQMLKMILEDEATLEEMSTGK